VFIGQAVENNTRSLAKEICRILVAAAEECWIKCRQQGFRCWSLGHWTHSSESGTVS